MVGGQGQRVVVQPGGHPGPVGVGQGGVADDPQLGEHGQALVLLEAVVDGPRRVDEPVEVGPHRRLHAVGHEMGVDVEDPRQPEVGGEGGQVFVSHRLVDSASRAAARAVSTSG